MFSKIKRALFSLVFLVLFSSTTLALEIPVATSKYFNLFTDKDGSIKICTGIEPNLVCFNLSTDGAQIEKRNVNLAADDFVASSVLCFGTSLDSVICSDNVSSTVGLARIILFTPTSITLLDEGDLIFGSGNSTHYVYAKKNNNVVSLISLNRKNLEREVIAEAIVADAQKAYTNGILFEDNDIVLQFGKELFWYEVDFSTRIITTSKKHIFDTPFALYSSNLNPVANELTSLDQGSDLLVLNLKSGLVNSETLSWRPGVKPAIGDLKYSPDKLHALLRDFEGVKIIDVQNKKVLAVFPNYTNFVVPVCWKQNSVVTISENALVEFEYSGKTTLLAMEGFYGPPFQIGSNQDNRLLLVGKNAMYQVDSRTNQILDIILTSGSTARVSGDQLKIIFNYFETRSLVEMNLTTRALTILDTDPKTWGGTYVYGKNSDVVYAVLAYDDSLLVRKFVNGIATLRRVIPIENRDFFVCDIDYDSASNTLAIAGNVGPGNINQPYGFLIDGSSLATKKKENYIVGLASNRNGRLTSFFVNENQVLTPESNRKLNNINISNASVVSTFETPDNSEIWTYIVHKQRGVVAVLTDSVLYILDAKSMIPLRAIAIGPSSSIYENEMTFSADGNRIILYWDNFIRTIDLQLTSIVAEEEQAQTSLTASYSSTSNMLTVAFNGCSELPPNTQTLLWMHSITGQEVIHSITMCKQPFLLPQAISTGIYILTVQKGSRKFSTAVLIERE
jgi:hypothetical protein